MYTLVHIHFLFYSDIFLWIYILILSFNNCYVVISTVEGHSFIVQYMYHATDTNILSYQETKFCNKLINVREASSINKIIVEVIPSRQRLCPFFLHLTERSDITIMKYFFVILFRYTGIGNSDTS